MHDGVFKLRERNGVSYFLSHKLEDTGKVKHFFSTRLGGVSEGNYKSLNLGVFTDDKKENIELNYQRIIGAAGIDEKSFVYLSQVHGNKFFVVDDKNCSDIRGAEGDALITSSKNIAIGVLTADCVPIIAVDYVKNVAAVIHAGWKGTHQEIAAIVIEYMIDDMGCRPDNIIAAIGPSIGPCCFEVGDSVAEKFKCVSSRNRRLYVDLWQENTNQILRCGINRDNIDVSRLCTVCEEKYFYSYRREKGVTGRLGAFVQLI